MLADGSRVSSSLTHDLCLGRYKDHPQLRAFYLTPDLLLQAGQRADLAAGALCFGGAAGWTLRALWAQLGDWQPELLIWWGFHYALPPDMADAPCPTVLIVSDWHYHYAAVREYLAAFDLVLCDRALLAGLEQQGVSNARYWPAYGFDPDMMAAPVGAQNFEPRQAREIDVCFLGNTNPATYQTRNRLLRQVAGLGDRYRILIRHEVPHPAYAQLLQRSKIVFNHALRREMNLRAYEAAACGALLFQEEDNLELGEILPTAGPQQACVTYNEANLPDLLDYYLRHPLEREAIALRGQQLIQAHSYERQFESLLRHLPQWLAEVGANRRQAVPSSEPALLQARQQITTDVPALRLHAVELLQHDLARLTAGTEPPPSVWLAWLNALAVCSSDSEGLLKSSGLPHVDAGQLLSELEAVVSPDLATLSNRAWLSFGLQHWDALARALQALGTALIQSETGDVESLTKSFYLPLRTTPLHTLRQRLLQQHAREPERLAAEWLRLLHWSLDYLAGQWQLARQNPGRAAEAFASACRIAPHLAESWLELGRCQLALNQRTEAIFALESGLAQGVYYPAVWPLLIELLLQNRDQASLLKARRYLIQAMTLFGDARYAGLHPRLVGLRQQLAI